MPTCRRCGDPFERLTREQVHCIRCGHEVATIIAADERRRTPRFRAGWSSRRAA